MASDGICSQPQSLHCSGLRQLRAIALPTLWTSRPQGAASLGHTGAEEAFSQRPVPAFNDPLVPVDVNPTAPDLDRVLCQQLVHRTQELAPRVNLKELRPPQGASLENLSQAIGDLFCSLACERLSLLEAAGDVNDRVSVA